MFNFDKVCELHKRILKYDATAIDEIETLEEAKEIIKMIESSLIYYVLTYSMGLKGIISEIEEEKNTDKVPCANVDLYSGLVYQVLGLSPDLYTPLFAVARIPGWCAHRIEELEFANRIMRPAYKCIQDTKEYKRK